MFRPVVCSPESSSFTFPRLFSRANLVTQVGIVHTQADSEKLARGIAEEQLSDVEKEKTMLELEIKELMQRHKNDMNKKETLLASVSCFHPLSSCCRSVPQLNTLRVTRYMCTHTCTCVQVQAHCIG